MLPSTPSMERRSITRCDTSANIAPLTTPTVSATGISLIHKLASFRKNFRGRTEALSNGVD
jgi:hypothetical protein